MIGSMLGSMAGGLIGGLFDKKKKPKPLEAEAFLAGNAFGLPAIDEEHDSHKLGDMGGQLGTNAKKMITDVLLAAGATMPDDVRSRISYFKGKKSEFYKASLYPDVPGLRLGEVGRYNSAEDAISALSAATLFVSGMQGKISGTGSSTQEAFKHLFDKGGKTAAGLSLFDVNKVNEIIDFTKWIDGFDKIRTVSDASRKAIDDFNASLAKFSSQADELGIGVDKVMDAMRRDFTESVSDDLLQLTDPRQFALDELAKEYAARKATAEKLGLDLVDLEKLYALKREQILDQSLKGIASTWQDFINSLQFGGLSGATPTDQLAAAKTQYESSKEVGGQTFRDAAQQYLAVQQQFYGSTKAYTDLFDEVVALAKQFGGLSGVPGYAVGTDWHPGGWAKIGEKGPELAFLPTGTSVMSADRTAAMMRMLANDNVGQRLRPNMGEKGAGGNHETVALRQMLNSTLQHLNLQSQRHSNELRLVLETVRQRA